MPSKRIWIISFILLALLIAGHIGTNWLWRTANVVVLGLDRTFHLVTSQVYDHILRDGLSLRTLFSALTWSDYYPPLVHMTIAGFYRLFGLSWDVAAMANSVYLALLLAAVYGIGARIGGPWAGLLSAAVVSLLPMVYAMSRYTYLDFPLASMVAASVCLLLWSDRFRRRGTAWLYGLSLGLGLLIKWTFVVFAAGPLLVILLRREVLIGAWRALRGALRDGRLLLLAAALGLAVTAAWFVPNRQAAAALPLGYWLAPLSWLVWSWTWAFVLAPRPRSGPQQVEESGVESTAAGSRYQGSNLLAALGLAACVAGSWYLTKINFLGAFWLNAYGKTSGRSWGFGQYFQLLFGEQLGPLLAVLIAAALAGLMVARWRHRASGPSLRSVRSLRSMLALGDEGGALVLWVVLSFVVMSSQVSIIHSRYILPLIAPLGIALAVALSRIPRRAARGLAVGGVLGVALVQFVALSFDGLDRLRALPVFAQGYFIQQPASGRTDPGYWIAPDVLSYVEQHRGTDPARLGILVNTQQVNSKQFIYMVYADYTHVQIQELAELGRGKGLYGRLFESDFLLIIDPPPNYARRPEARETLERLLKNEDDTFHRAYDLARTYPLPDGTRVMLYERRLPSLAETDLAPFEALMADLRARAGPGDAVIVSPPELVDGLARFDDGTLDIYPVSAADASRLAGLARGHARLWLVTGDTRAADPEGLVARWSTETQYPAGHWWHGPLQLGLYAPAAEGDTRTLSASGALWQDRLELVRYGLADSSVPLGGIARLDLVWQARRAGAGREKVFVHLLNAQGELVSQQDGEPGDGARPTDGWPAGQEVLDRHGLLLPATLPPGDYRLVVGLYPADGGDRLPVCCPAGDSLTLARVRVEGGVARLVAGP